MSDKVFVDTNILVYAHDHSTGIKGERAQALIQELWDTGNAALSAQVLQELCVNLRQRVARPWPIEETRSLLEDYMSWEIVVNTPASVIEAMTLAARHQVSFWDALILQAAGSCGARILYSEDFSDGQTYGSLRVVNPLTETFSA